MRKVETLGDPLEHRSGDKQKGGSRPSMVPSSSIGKILNYSDEEYTFFTNLEKNEISGGMLGFAPTPRIELDQERDGTIIAIGPDSLVAE